MGAKVLQGTTHFLAAPKARNSTVGGPGSGETRWAALTVCGPKGRQSKAQGFVRMHDALGKHGKIIRRPEGAGEPSIPYVAFKMDADFDRNMIAGFTALAPDQGAEHFWRTISQGIAALSLGLYSGGPLGRVDGLKPGLVNWMTACKKLRCASLAAWTRIALLPQNFF